MQWMFWIGGVHILRVCNRVLPETIGAVPQLQIRDELVDVPSVHEVWKSNGKLKNDKAAGNLEVWWRSISE